MDKQHVVEFFDRLAPQWDADMISDGTVIAAIFDHANIRNGISVLDVACGTGVLTEEYLKRGVASVTGVDISPNMIRIAQNKFSYANVRFICADIEEAVFKKPFDCAVVYNAFPHFPNPDVLIKALADDLKTGGTLTVAHGMSREKIDSHHSGTAEKVSVGLMHEDELEKVFDPYFEVTCKISNDRMYQVVGIKRI